ncbi:alpha/beta hydrolase [Hyphomonas sp. CACIAM 19H1]|uniref:alpha/beta hydrolase n=1 Tax=Hyphomonas sp. CACIAM 19H1 TaxID=1873716 RepID=UPI001F39E79C|nr:alpha/beta hydrolase [Hyphomonas sp. CACIAM 19H1]
MIIPLYEAGEITPLGVPETRVVVDEAGETFIFNVSDPAIEVFLPASGDASGVGVIVAPGGGFVGIGYEQGGAAIARRLAGQGVTAFVLKYRTIPSAGDPYQLPAVHLEEMQRLMDRAQTGTPAEIPGFAGEAAALADGVRAIELIRENAADWGVDPRRVGVLGFSAGAFLAVDLAIGEEADRPDFIGVLYGGLRTPVPGDAPPAFIASAADDEMLRNDSVRIFQAWVEAGAEAELHVYERGGHGFDLRPNGTTSDAWFDQFIAWMRMRGLMD